MSRINHHVLDLIKARIAIEGRTKSSLAEICGVSLPMLSMGLAGQKNLREDVLLKLITILNIQKEIVELGLMPPQSQKLSTEMMLGLEVQS